MNVPIFSNTYNITDYNFKKMIDRWENSKKLTNDYEIQKEMKQIISNDYYVYATEWYDKFKNAEWWREDLI